MEIQREGRCRCGCREAKRIAAEADAEIDAEGVDAERDAWSNAMGGPVPPPIHGGDCLHLSPLYNPASAIHLRVSKASTMCGVMH